MSQIRSNYRGRSESQKDWKNKVWEVTNKIIIQLIMIHQNETSSLILEINYHNQVETTMASRAIVLTGKVLTRSRFNMLKGLLLSKIYSKF